MVDNSWTEIVKLSFTEDVCIIVVLALRAFRKSKTGWFFLFPFPCLHISKQFDFG